MQQVHEATKENELMITEIEHSLPTKLKIDEIKPSMHKKNRRKTHKRIARKMSEIEEEKDEEEDKKIGWRLRKAGKFADKGFSKMGSKIGNFGKKLNPFARK